MAPPIEFPHQGILPKEETQAAELLGAHPQHDGRGVLIAILDTGVDPGAAGLQTTPDGKPKLADTIDCSGSGDVDTSTIVEALPSDDTDDEAGAADDAVVIQGLSGRKLKLSPSWKNPTGKWRVGVKRAQELYPGGLKGRVKAERRKEWTIEHRKVEAELQRAAAAFRAAKGSKPPATADEAQEAADMEARVGQLAEAGKAYDDAGCLYDCVVWHDGERWWAAIDVGESGDLRAFKPMTDYHVQRDWRTFNAQLDNLNFAVNIYDDGAVLSIVVDAGSHGTHVAGITAAYDKDNPELNGLAPGAQLVSLKIGDTRLGSMETGVSVVRALSEVVRLGCDMINMSYGEAVAVNETGRIMKLIEEVVHKHGVIYVGSASNNGPALSTVGAPAGSGTSAIAVGAYLTPSMMVAGYSLRKPKQEGVNFTWSSVGPSYDGEQGPTIVAPGGAITSVPNWTLQKSMLMNGTSMASPNACGSIALVLSALKAQDVPYTPHLIRRAVTATAKDTGLHPLVQGHGMLQVAAALDYATRFYAEPYAGLPLKVSVQGVKAGRGVYLREAGESAVSRDFKVTVEPRFHEGTATSAEKVAFEAHVALSLQSADPKAGSWVTVPGFFVLVNNGRGFTITVDGSRLPPGLHVAKVVGHDVKAPPELGALFEVPITVVKPLEFDAAGSPAADGPTHHQLLPAHGGVRRLGVHAFTSGQVTRHFLVPPPGTTWMDVTLTDLRAHAPTTGTGTAGEAGTVDAEGPGPEAAGGPEGERDGRVVIVALQTVQLLPQTPFRDAEFERYVSLAPGQRETYSVLVEAGTTVELALAQYAISEGQASVALDVEFRGLKPRKPDVTLAGGQGFVSVAVDALVHDEELAPAAKLDRWQTRVTPASAAIAPLGAPRDVLPDGKYVYQLILEYSFTVSEAGGEEVTPRTPLLNGVLYESPFEAQMFMAYDGSKKLLGCGDAWPGSVKCPKGDVLIRLSVRHDELPLLESLKAMPLVLERALKGGKEVAVPDYATREEAMLRRKVGGGGGARMLRKGCTAAVVLAEPAFDKVPKGAKPGDLLLGSLTLEKGGKEGQPKSKRPKGWPLTYVVPPPPAEAPKPPSKPTPPDERPEEAKLADKVRGLKVSHLSSVTEPAAFEKLFAALLEEYPGHIPLLQARLRFLDAEKGRGERLEAIVAAADAVIREVDQTALALHFGTKVDESDPAQVKLRGEMEETKAALADALARKARALIEAKGNAEPRQPQQNEGDSGSPVEVSWEEKAEAVAPAAAAAAAAKEEEGEGDEVTATLKELGKWDSLDKDVYARLVLEREGRKGRWGLVVQLLNKLLADPGNGSGIPKEELYTLRAKAYELLGWHHLLENERKWRVIDCPKAYALF